MGSTTRRILIRFLIVVGWTSALYTIYQAPNRFHIRPPVELPLTAIDLAIPFWTWTVVPYFMLIGGMYLPALVHDAQLFRRALMALTIGALLNYAIFLLWPTTYPRPPLPDGNAFYDTWYRWLTSIDTPANCFPSGHITAPAVGCWALAQEHPRWRWVIALVFVPFTLTILTTKQHYVWDLLGGFTTAVIGILATRRMTSEPPPKST